MVAFFFFGEKMYLPYLDGSGSAKNKNEDYLVLAGVLVFERQAHWISKSMDKLADHIAYSVFRRYEHGDTKYLDVILSRFDSKNNVLHGLAHKQNIDPNCMCPAYMSRG